MAALDAVTEAAFTPEITGATTGLFTVTETPALVVAVFPDVSVAVADNTCAPLATPVVFQLTLYPGPLPVTAVPRLVPSTRNCTLATAMLSVALADTVTVPLTLPAAGAVIV